MSNYVFDLTRPSEFGPPSDDFCDRCLGTMHFLYFCSFRPEWRHTIPAKVLDSAQAADKQWIQQSNIEGYEPPTDVYTVVYTWSRHDNANCYVCHCFQQNLRALPHPGSEFRVCWEGNVPSSGEYTYQATLYPISEPDDVSLDSRYHDFRLAPPTGTIGPTT